MRGRRRVTGCLGSRRTWVFSSVPPLPKLLLRASASLAVKRWMTRQGLCSSSLRSLGWELASGTSVWSSRVFCLLCMHPGPGLQTGPWLAVLQGPGSPVCPLSGILSSSLWLHGGAGWVPSCRSLGPRRPTGSSASSSFRCGNRAEERLAPGPWSGASGLRPTDVQHRIRHTSNL